MFARAVSHYEVRQEAKMTLQPKLFQVRMPDSGRARFAA